MISAGSRHSFELAGKTVLLVEDEAIIAMNEAAVLSRHGLRVVTAHSGTKAIELVRSRPIDLILMDVDLGTGNMDGTETGRKILEEYDIPVVFLSSHTEPEVVDKTEKITSYGYVVKNSGETVLITSIKMAFKLHQAHMTLKENEAELSAIYEHTPVLMVMLDEERRIRKANATTAGFAQTSTANLLGKRSGEALRCLNHLDDPRGCGYGPSCIDCPVRRIVKDTFNNGHTTRQTEATLPFLIDGKNRQLTFLVSAVLLRVKGEPLVLVSLEDITELKESKDLLQWKLDHILYPEYEIDQVNLANIIDRNEIQAVMDAFTEVTGIGMGLTDLEGNILVTSGLQRLCTDFHRANPEMKSRCIESDKAFNLGLKKGEIAEVKCRNNIWDLATPVFIADKRVGTIYCGQFFYDDERIEFDFFEKQAETFGLDKEAYLKSIQELPRHNRETIQKAMTFFIRFAEVISTLGYRNLKLTKMHYNQKQLAEQLERSKQRYQALFDYSPFGIAEIDADGTLITVNKTAAARAGLEPKDQIGKNRSDFFPEDVVENRNRKTQEALKNNSIVEFVDKERGRTYHHTVVPMFTGDVSTVQSITEDITEQKQTEKKLKETNKQLRQMIEEKEYLMKEINHRVKNNLLMISSLINLKASSMKEDVDLSDIHHQVDAIRIVHEKLYQSEDITHIDFGQYCSQLLSTIFSSFTSREVVFENRIEDIMLPTKSAIPLGLIINELATNAVKHGFDPAKPARFTITLEHQGGENRYLLTVSNSGNPFPSDIDIREAQTLGLRLITALVGQLNGEIELEREPETTFSITFYCS